VEVQAIKQMLPFHIVPEIFIFMLILINLLKVLPPLLASQELLGTEAVARHRLPLLEFAGLLTAKHILIQQVVMVRMFNVRRELPAIPRFQLLAVQQTGSVPD